MTTLEKINELRKERGWSINYLAMEAMLTQSTVNNLFLRKTEPKLSTLTAICGAFGITLAEFFSDLQEDDVVDINEELKKEIDTLTVSQKKTLLSFLKTL